MTAPDDRDPAGWIDVLAGSHDRLCELVGELDGAGLRRPSYCSDWSIAQVLSHLGSGAEIFLVLLDAVVAGEPTPSRDVMQPIWDRWNALAPEEQAEALLSTDGQLVETLENLGDRLDDLSFTFFGAMRLDAVGVLGMRLSEHAVHTWDIAVALDPAATVDPDAVALLVDRLPQVAGRSGKAEGAPWGLAVVVATSEPDRVFSVRVGGHAGDGVRLEPGDGRGDGGGAGESDAGSGGVPVHLPAEAFLRLVYGRLDPAHTPPLEAAAAAAVEALRPVFAGF